MSSLLERVALAIRVFREDPDSVVTLNNSSGCWTASYQHRVEYEGDTEVDALGSLFFSMKFARDKQFRKSWSTITNEWIRENYPGIMGGD